MNMIEIASADLIIHLAFYLVPTSEPPYLPSGKNSSQRQHIFDLASHETCSCDGKPRYSETSSNPFFASNGLKPSVAPNVTDEILGIDHVAVQTIPVLVGHDRQPWYHCPVTTRSHLPQALSFDHTGRLEAYVSTLSLCRHWSFLNVEIDIQSGHPV